MYTMYSQLCFFAKKTPDKIVVIESSTSLNYRELLALVNKIISLINCSKLDKKSYFGVETENPIIHLAGCIAVMESGGVAVPLPTGERLKYTDIVKKMTIDLIITNNREYKDKAIYMYISSDQRADGRISTSTPNSEDIAMVYYTSGTTSGVGKGVMQSYRMLDKTVNYISEKMHISPDIVEFIASPVDNAFWFGRCRVVLKNGGTLVLNKGALNIFEIIFNIKKYSINSISGDTPIYLMLLRYMKDRVRLIGNQIKWVKIASQAMHIDDKKLIIKMFPNARIIMNYGLTEAMRCTLLSFNDNPEKLESVGNTAKGVEIKIINNDINLDRGEIWVRGDNLCSGYVNEKDLWHSKFNNGWFLTGDIGYLDQDGFLYVEGRSDEAINIEGKTISPMEIERVVNKYILNDVAVVSYSGPINKNDHIVVMVVDGKIDSTEGWNNVRLHLLEDVNSLFIPKDIYISDIGIPKTANGKVLRNQILENIKNNQYYKYNE